MKKVLLARHCEISGSFETIRRYLKSIEVAWPNFDFLSIDVDNGCLDDACFSCGCNRFSIFGNRQETESERHEREEEEKKMDEKRKRSKEIEELRKMATRLGVRVVE